MIRLGTGCIFLLCFTLITTCTHTVVNKYADFKCLRKLERKDLALDPRARKFTVQVDYTSRLSEYDRGLLIIASHLATTVIRTEQFRQAILNYEHNGYKGFMGTDMSRQQVYDTIMKGAEKFNGDTDYRMNFVATSYKPTEIEKEKDEEERRVVAFVYSSGKYVFFNEEYLYHNATRKANTITHEWLHLLGFEHEKEDTDTREYTVPYAVGDIVQEIATEYYDYSCWWK